VPPLDDLYQLDPVGATSNSNLAGANIAELCLPSGINNAIRALASMTARAISYQSAAISSSVSTNLATASSGLAVAITGANAISSFGVVPGEQPSAAVLRIVEFSSSASLSHGTSLVLLGGASRRTQPGDVGIYLHQGSSDRWKEITFSRASGIDLLTTQTAAASATIDFVLTHYANTYRAFKVVITDLVPATDATDLYLRFSTDGGSTYDAGASDYDWARNMTTAAGSNITNGDTADSEITLSSDLSNVTAESLSGQVIIYNPANSAQHTKAVGDFISPNSSGQSMRVTVSGRRLATQDTDGIRFLISSGNITSGTFALYGIR
jgi:hypothetical protein